MTMLWTLTRENFLEVGEQCGAVECWGLAAPIPELRFGSPLHFVRARLGDVVIKEGSRVLVQHVDRDGA